MQQATIRASDCAAFDQAQNSEPPDIASGDLRHDREQREGRLLHAVILRFSSRLSHHERHRHRLAGVQQKPLTRISNSDGFVTVPVRGHGLGHATCLVGTGSLRHFDRDAAQGPEAPRERRAGSAPANVDWVIPQGGNSRYCFLQRVKTKQEFEPPMLLLTAPNN